MKRSLPALAIALAVPLAACSNGGSEAAPESSPSEISVTPETPRATPSGSTATTSSPTATQEEISPGDEIEISCRTTESEDTGEFSSIEDAWSLDVQDRARCSGWYDMKNFDKYELTEVELAAVREAGYDDEDSLHILYGMCASSHLGDHEERKPYGENQATEVHGALVLCPEHPEREEVESRIAATEERSQELREMEEMIDRGDAYLNGSYRVGEDISPGLYVSESETEVEGCYWQRLDSAGNIIANNFIQGGFRVEVHIQPTDYSFSSEGCDVWVAQ